MAALTVLFGILLFSIALFLILLVLVQRGRGGGLSGALGGMGGQSAFGTKAGDLFTRITIVVATTWILLCMAAILVLNPQRSAAVSSEGEGEYRTPTMEKRDTQPEADGAKPEGPGVGGVTTPAAAEAEAPAAAGPAEGSSEPSK